MVQKYFLDIYYKTMIREAAIIPKPQYKVKLEGVSFAVQFDTNINETKRGVKIRFYPQSEQQLDIRKLNDLANKIAVILQKKFAEQGLQIDRDTEVQDPTVIGFMLPLASIANFVMNRVIKGA